MLPISLQLMANKQADLFFETSLRAPGMVPFQLKKQLIQGVGADQVHPEQTKSTQGS
jgi:hypothetical protein